MHNKESLVPHRQSWTHLRYVIVLEKMYPTNAAVTLQQQAQAPIEQHITKVSDSSFDVLLIYLVYASIVHSVCLTWPSLDS